jgi:uncharacterized protein YfaS (alpha-2-macroglobulin family)
MKKKLFILILIICFIIISSSFFTGCKKKEGTEKESKKSAKLAEKIGDTKASTAIQTEESEEAQESASKKWQQMLATDMQTLQTQEIEIGKEKVYVVSYHPQGQTRNVDEVDEINITFSEPVAPLEKIEKEAPSLIEIEPFVKGEGYWKSSITYCYRIDEKVKLSTKYTVKFRGYTSFSGKKIAEKQWEFITPTIKIIDSIPRHNVKWQTLDQKVLVEFSQTVKPNQIKDYIKILSSEGKYDFEVRYATKQERELKWRWERLKDDNNRIITIIPRENYPIATDITAQFLEGLPSSEGNIGLLDIREIRFRTYEIFKIIKVSKEFIPDKGISIRCSNPVPVQDFVKKIIFEPPVKLNEPWEHNSNYFSIHGKFKPGESYTMIIPADVQDQFGNELGEEEKFSIKCLDYTPFFYPPSHHHFVMENYLEKSIPVRVRNVFETEVLYREMEQDDFKLLSTIQYLKEQDINLKDCDMYLWKIPIKKNLNYTLGFDLKNIQSTKPGFYYVYFKNASSSAYRGHFIQLTDIALVAKFSPTQIFLMPFNMKSGEPVPHLDFSIYDPNGSFFERNGFANVKGDKDGIAVYQPPLKVLEKHKLRDCFILSEPRKSFVWGRKNDMFDMWDYRYRYNLNYNQRPENYYNHLLLFTDKYLYKAGQTVRFKGILRQVFSGIMRIPALKNIKGKVFNSRNENIHEFELKRDDFTSYGTFAGEFKLPGEAPTGFYRVDFDVELEKSSFSKSLRFSVEEYKPAKFEVTVALDQKELIAGQRFSGHINAKYLFGTPMVDAEGNCVWTIQNTYFAPKGWDSYSFGTYESSYRDTIFKKEFKLDNKGNYNFSEKSISLPGKNSGRLTVYGEVKDKDNNRIGSQNSLIVHRGKYYIGLKAESYFFEKDKLGKISLVTVSPQGDLFKKTALTVKITRDEWKSFQKKDASGALRWEWKHIVEDISEEEVSLPDGKIEKEYTFEKAGYYTIALTGADSLGNTITTSGHFYVTGSGYVSWGVNEGRIIDLVTNKEEYKPGEKIELLIKSPFETSTALITIERENVIWSKIVRMEGNADTVKIPITKAFVPNVFANVIIMKERTEVKWDDYGNDIGKPEFYSGYKEIKIDSSENELNIKITADKKSYEPGEKATLDIKVTDKRGKPIESEICLSVVDKGVLNLVGYELPNPYDFFWKNRPLDVKTVSTLGDVLGRRKFQEKGEEPGGGVGTSPFGSVVVRKKFKESAYYSAFINTDKKGQAKISFDLPENLTTFKAMAVAGDIDKKFGKGTLDILVKKNLILKPALPDFARIGDRFSGGVTVTNNSDKKLNISVKVEYEDIIKTKDDPDIQKIMLDPAETQPVWYSFEVDSLKTAKLTFKAVAGKYQDGLYQEIPVRMPKFTEAVANYGRVDKKPIREQIIVPKDTFRDLDDIEVTLASSAMVGVKRNFDILQEFPYDCLEQRLSKQYPLLGAGEFLLTYGLLDMSREEINSRIQNLLNLMPRYQGQNGGFKYYPDSIWVSEYLTCYATEFILEAKKQGFKIDSEMLKGAEEYLKNVAAKKIDSRYPYSRNVYLLVQAYSVYVLSMDNILLKDVVNNLFEVRDRIPFSGLAYLVKALEVKNDLPDYMQPVLAKTILNKMKVEPTMAHFENNREDRISWWWVHESNAKTTAIVLDTFLSVYQKFPQAEKIARWLTSTTKQKRYMSTQEHIKLFMAFEQYFRVFESETPNFVAEVLFNDELKIKEAFLGRELKTREHHIPLNQYSPGEKIDVTLRKDATGKGILYYLLRVKYYPMGEVEAIDRGFSVEKVFKTLNGKVVTNNTFQAGEKYIVELKVTTNQERPFVILDDPVPSGMKVLNPRFKTTASLDMEQASYDSTWKGYWGKFYRSEYYFDRVELFSDYLRRGTHTWTYLVVATNGGAFTVPNTVVMEMYNPEVFGRNENRKIEIK